MPPTELRQWHYVKPNETTSVPRRLIFLDTESHSTRDPLGHTQTWALAVACFRSQRPDRKPTEAWECFDDPEILWKAVDAYVGKSGRTVLWTHNLGYDSRIAEMFELLPSMGFTLVAHNLIGKGCWLMWRRGRASLTMVDSTSVFPCELLRLGVYLGLPKLPLPPEGARGVGLYSRCWRDVEILRAAVLAYLDWIEREDLGNWQLTGAGQSWATFRHRFMDRRLLVHDDQDALCAERRAMWTGRCEAYWHGELGFQVVHEWDLSLAYPRIAKDINVPVRLLGPMPDDYNWMGQLASTHTALLAQCTVTTDLPIVPTEHNGRIIWPTGTFTTTLWDPEIRALIDGGATVTVHKGWLYHKAPALRKWAEWVIGQLDNLADMTEHWLYIVLKHWARALIGRFAMTYVKWEEYAIAPTNMVRAHSVYDAQSGETFRTVQIGRTMWRETGAREWGESMPMVTGYVQSVARVRLWQISSEAPAGSVLYCDTDSVLVTDMHSAAIAAIAARHLDWGLRLKRSWQGFAVWGPRQIRTGESIRVSGVARHAVRTDKTHFTGQVWETLEGALVRGHPSKVVVRDRVWEVKGTDHRRDGPALGWTAPHRLGDDGDSPHIDTEEATDGQAQPGQRTPGPTPRGRDSRDAPQRTERRRGPGTPPHRARPHRPGEDHRSADAGRGTRTPPRGMTP